MRVKILLISVLLAILLSAGVHSFGIAFQYMDNNTIELYPGQNYMFELVIQNTEDESEKVQVTLDSSIATLIGGPILNVPGKTYDTNVYFNITVPENAQYGDIYNINYLVAPVTGGEGQIPIAIKYDRGFKIRVVAQTKAVEEQEPIELPPEKFSIPGWIYIPALIIMIIVVLVLVWRKSHQISGGITKTRFKPSSKSSSKPSSKLKSHIFKPKNKPSVGILTKLRAEKKPKAAFKSHETFVKPSQGYVKQEEHHTREFIQKPVEKEKPVQPKPQARPIHREPVPQQKEKVALKPSQYFHLYDGRTLRDLEDLSHILHNMTQKTFNHHVTSTKNDFAVWVGSTLKKQGLARKLSEKNSRHDMLVLIENELESK